MAIRTLSVLLLGTALQQASGEGEQIFGGHYNTCRGISFKPDGSQIVLASEDNPGNLRPDPPTVHNLADGNTLKLPGHAGPVWDAVFDNWDGSRIATCSADSTVKVWSLRLNVMDNTQDPPVNTGNQWGIDHNLAGTHAGHVMSLDWHPTNYNRFVACDSSGSFVVWTYDTNALSVTFQTWVPMKTGAPNPSELNPAFAVLDGVPRILTDVKYAPNGDWIAVCGFHLFANVFSPSNVIGKTWNTAWLMGPNAFTHGASVWGVHFSANNQYIITAGYDRLANVFEDSNFGNNQGASFTFKASLSISIYDYSWTRTCPTGVPAGCNEEIGCACPAPHYIGGPVWSVGFYGTMPITGDSDHIVRMWGWEADKYVPMYSFKGCLAPPWDITISKTNPPMLAAACGTDPTGRIWPIPAAAAYTTTTTTTPWPMYQGAAQHSSSPSFLLATSMLLVGLAARRA